MAVEVDWERRRAKKVPADEVAMRTRWLTRRVQMVRRRCSCGVTAAQAEAEVELVAMQRWQARRAQAE